MSDSPTPIPVKASSKRSIVERRERARARQEVASKRTPEEQLKRLDSAGLPAAKERAKLALRIKARSEKPQPKQQPGPTEAQPVQPRPAKSKKDRAARGSGKGNSQPSGS